jgi:hypothetical protein
MVTVGLFVGVGGVPVTVSVIVAETVCDAVTLKVGVMVPVKEAVAPGVGVLV